MIELVLSIWCLIVIRGNASDVIWLSIIVVVGVDIINIIIVSLLLLIIW